MSPVASDSAVAFSDYQPRGRSSFRHRPFQQQGNSAALDDVAKRGPSTDRRKFTAR
jgi:hypothetical protein